MSFLEWRKFHFFDLKKDVDEGQLKSLFPDESKEISATSHGNNHLVLGDSTGKVYLISRGWKVVDFNAYALSVDFIYQLRNCSILVTIGHDEPGVNPLLKVWDTSGKYSKNNTPYCLRSCRTLAGNRASQVSCLSVEDALQLMAVGFVNGFLVLYRGDITRERSSKLKVFPDSSSQVTGLAFKSSAKSTFLFVSTETSVLMYNITVKDKEQKFNLDNIGCLKRCSVLADSFQDSHFMIARNDAIYCYTSDGRGPCYAVDGDKVLLEWFRSYLIIVYKSTAGDSLTVLDIHNKFIVFTVNLPHRIRAVLSEWGAFYVLAQDNTLYHLDEKDLQSKLSLLFKKNLYDVAIRIAKSQQYDSDGLIEIFKQYGDHLCEKGDFQGAMEQYIKTIGKLEASYVIRKFLDSQHIEKLTKYLQELHNQNQASENHTTLLLNCFTKLNNAKNQSDSLRNFILSKEDVTYNVEVAIKVCRFHSPAEALMLAKKHEKHDFYIKLLIEDHKNFKEVLQYLSELSLENAQFYMKKYGHYLIESEPQASLEFLKKLSLDDPEDYIHLFLNNSELLVDFIEYLIKEENCLLSVAVYNVLLEHYLNIWVVQSLPEKTKLGVKIIKLLQNPDLKYDKAQALVVCHLHGFSEGILYLYEEQKLYQQILRFHISNGDCNAVLACCRRFGHQEPKLWVQALWACVRNTQQPFAELLKEILDVIAKDKLSSPRLVVDAVASGASPITLGLIRSYLTNELTNELKTSREATQLTQNYRKDTEELKQHLKTLKSGSVVIQGSRCAACHHPLELPTIHFLCQHSFHQHCFQSFSDEEDQCPTCQPENKNLIELLKAREYNKDLNETFHFQLEKANDGFSVAAEYFGRGVFNTYKVIVDEPKTQKLLPTERKFEEKKIEVSPLKTLVNTNPFEKEEPRFEQGKNPFDDDVDDDYDKNLNPFA